MAKRPKEDVMFMLGEIHSDVKAIKEQTTKTNGRVNKHEKEIDNLNIWRAGVTGKFVGAMAVIGFIYSLMSFYIPPLVQKVFASVIHTQ